MTRTRILLLMGLLASAVLPAAAGMRTATMSVSATVVASCRVSIAPFASPQGTVQHRGYCSQDSRPLTRAVIENERPMPPGVVVRTQLDPAQRWIRYDVEY